MASRSSSATAPRSSATLRAATPRARSSPREQIEANAQTYVDQAFKILDPEKTTLRYNSEWLLALDMEGLLKLISNFTVARILERDDFHNRYTDGPAHQPARVPLPACMQAYDSVVIKADVEMGGTDQLFNLLAGRELMEKMGMEPQVCPHAAAARGHRRRAEDVEELRQLHRPHRRARRHVRQGHVHPRRVSWRNTTGWRPPVRSDEIDEIERGLAADELAIPTRSSAPWHANIVAAYHDEAAAAAAEDQFDLVFKHACGSRRHRRVRGRPRTERRGHGLSGEDASPTPGSPRAAGEARRLIDGGGVKINGEALPAKSYNVDPARIAGAVVQVGKRKFVRIR